MLFQTALLQHFFSALADRAQSRQTTPEDLAITMRRQHRSAQVFLDAQLRKDIGDLEAARQAEAIDLERTQAGYLPPMQNNLAAADLGAAGYQIEQG